MGLQALVAGNPCAHPIRSRAWASPFIMQHIPGSLHGLSRQGGFKLRIPKLVWSRPCTKSTLMLELQSEVLEYHPLTLINPMKCDALAGRSPVLLCCPICKSNSSAKIHSLQCPGKRCVPLGRAACPCNLATTSGSRYKFGHYRALLKLRPGLTSDSFPYQWMLTDDSCRPEPVWHVPGWMRANVTVLWLIRVDCLQLCTYTTPAPLSGTEHSADASMEDSNALLTLLHSQDGVTGGFHDASTGQ